MSMPPGTTMKAMVALPKDPAQCWQWLGAFTDGGYPRKRTQEGDTTAQRWMWKQLFGPIPKSFNIHTTCGNFACMNPHHMACSHRADALRAGGSAKLVPGDVLAIRSVPKPMRDAQEARRQGEKYDVSPKTVIHIWGRTTWKRTPPSLKAPVARGVGHGR